MRNTSLELLRGIAAFGIVGCHLALTPMTEGAWQVRALCDMNVCLFAAISGWLFAESMLKRESDGTCEEWWSYVKRRAIRLLPTYFIWSIIYILFGLVFDLLIRHQLNPKLSRDGFWLGVLFRGDASTHLWFLICLFYAQVALKVVVSNPVGKKLIGWIWMAIGLVVIISVARSGSWFGRYFVRLAAALVSGYGLCLISCYDSCRLERILAVIFVTAGTIMHYTFASFCPVFIRDWMLAMVLLYAGTRIRLPSRLEKIAVILGGTSMGVFLLHPILAAGFGVVVRRLFNTPFVIGTLLLDWIIVWVVSLILTFILIKIPRFRSFLT